ncbi:MAG TPA: HAD-IA family hydrolase [Gemmatimonas sp.]|nr:HAD-IA family hydrolase [Gemmatimonas sp.]
MTADPIRAVVFDLLTGLLDSWTLWNAVAGDAATGARWRQMYLRLTYAQGAYRPYLDLVADAAVAAGLPATLAGNLAREWHRLQPWPDVQAVLTELRAQIPLGVVTNCSTALGTIAAERVGVPLDAVITAEAVGCYKPDRRCYLAVASALGVAPAEILFVAGSPFDIVGASAAGMPVYWHNHAGQPIPDGLTVTAPYIERRDLADLRDIIRGGLGDRQRDR